MKKILAFILLAAMLATCLISCGDDGDKKEVSISALDDYLSLNGKVYGTDYCSLYEQFGDDITIADVKEDEDGFAYITVDGVDYTLGLDFLTMAMVYNTTVPAGSTAYASEDDVYAKWFEYYLLRWNAILPEVPLYSNEYYDLYNKKLGGVTENPTNPYWNADSALIDWTSTDDKIILGSTTELSEYLRYYTFAVSSGAASNADVSGLINGLSTVTTNKEGGYQWDDTVVKSHTEVDNEDGTKTYTIEIYEDLKFSDGSAITAKNYLVSTLVFSTPVAAEAQGGVDKKAAMTVVGYDEFAAYDGTNDGVKVDDVTASKYLSGLKLLGDYKFSVTISADYLPYFYAIAYASFGPEYLSLWLNDADIIVDEETKSVGLSDNFFASTGEGNDKTYTYAAHILASAKDNTTTYPCSGAYYIESYNATDKTATLKKNTYYKGNFEGTKPSIGTVVYKKLVSATQLDDFKAGGVDVLSGITGGNETNEAINYTKEADSKGAVIHYSRAGYGKLGFRADFGPVQFTEVRQAIAYCMDRAQFAKDFTGGYGGVVDAPYYSGAWMYKQAKAAGMVLDSYTTSLTSAIKVLEAGGWVYNADGTAYDSKVGGVRYKAISASLISDADKTYASVDGKYKTVQVGDYYLMPLVINWYGSEDNEFTDLLQTGFKSNANIKSAGFEVQATIGSFTTLLGELYQYEGYGYQGTPTYVAFNFATSFSSAAYDYSWNCTIDPSMFEDYSTWYIKDTADFYWITK